MKQNNKINDKTNNTSAGAYHVSARGITLIALVITIIVLLILAGVALTLTIGQNGIINNAKYATQENSKQTATEKINLKITNLQMSSYAQEQRMPTLQELADNFCGDDEIEYVNLVSKKVASLTKVEVGQNTSIFTKLKEYPYEFEINSSLQLASVDGIKIATNSSANAMYQKVRSDVSIDVPITQTFTAPTDGYYILITNVTNTTQKYQSYVTHYLADGNLIETCNTGGYQWMSLGGCNIYMKKGEYITITKEANVQLISSKFWYAEGEQPIE